MIDIHSHLLYDIDDGPKTLRDTIELCEYGLEQDIEATVLTPHLTKPERVDSLISKRDRHVEALREELDRIGIDMLIYTGAEVFVNDDIFYAKKLEKAAINNGRYILVEFDVSSLSIKRLISYLNEIFDMGLLPIVAHPERYKYFQNDYAILNYLVDMDVLFQVNAGSVARFGKREEFELAYQMVLNNAATFIATDAHSLDARPNDLLRMVRHFPPDIKRESLDFMLYEAPAAVINNEKIPRIPRRPITAKKRFFR
ncbi:MAG: hypothetical protein K6F09_05930 [Clostridiales bacterium]|nr:hypothetical protein [Clostridiales bacterium]